MKTKKIAITSSIVIALVIVILLRLTANKRSLDAALNAGNDFNMIIPVLVDTVKEEQINTQFKVNGSFSPLYDVTVASETQGRVTSLFAEIGDNVAASQQLALVDTELTAVQFKQAKSYFDKAEKDLKRFDLLSKDDAVSAEQYESVKLAFVNAQSACVAARKQYENSVVKAPVSGIVTKRYIETGSFLAPGMPVFDIVGIHKVKFTAKLTSDEILTVNKGQAVTVTVDSYPGVIYKGFITSVAVNADLSKRYDVEVEVSNSNEKFIRPGMYGAAIFGGQSVGQALAIQRKALVGSIKTPEVFKVEGDSVVLQSIAAEPLSDKFLAVTQGVKAGDIIVTSGQINLKNGSKIKITK